MTATEIEPATADAAGGLLPETADLAAEYGRLTAEGNRLLDQADALLIRSGLAALARGVEADLTRHEADLARTCASLDAAEAELAPLRAELAECQRRAHGIRAARSDQALDVRISARSLRAAVVEEIADLEARIDAAETRLRLGYLRDLTTAYETDIAGCQAELCELADAEAQPFRHPRAMETSAYLHRVYSGRTIPVLFGADRWHPEYDDAYALMVQLCRITGFGAAHEARVEAGATDPYKLVHHNLDGVAWRGRLATLDQVAATIRPPVRVPSDAEMANASIFDQGGRTPGLRGSPPGGQP
jgi:hypothetical protein